MMFAVYMAVSFNTFFCIYWFCFVSLNIWLCVLCASVYFVNDVFLLLCILIVMFT
jgi:hypothetical protein